MLSNKMNNKFKSIIIYSLLTVFALFFIIPYLWILSTSLKGDAQIFTIPPQWIPETFHWENYARVFERIPFLLYLKNSVFISAIVVAGTLLSSSIVAYSFGCLNWPGRNFLFIIVLTSMMLPIQVIMIPVFVIFKEIGWLNTFKPLTLPAFLGGGAFNIFLLRQFFISIPKDLLDSARIDGCSEFRIYWNIVLPNAKPALATVAILTFMFSWNDFLGPLIYLSDQAKGTIALGLGMFVGQYVTEWSLLMAASMLMMLPMLLIFFVFQKYFIQGFIMSGIKD